VKVPLVCSAFVLSLAVGAPADADVPNSTGWMGSTDNEAVLVVGAVASADGSTTVVVTGPRSSRPIRYEAVPASDPSNPLVGICGTEPGAFDGWIYKVIARNTKSGQAIGEPRIVCVPFPDPDIREIPPPPELPQPPTVEEIWNSARIPQPVVHTSPIAEGVTGLETWLWAESPETVTVSTPPLNGYVVTGTARCVGFRFDFGDGAVVEARSGGTEREPAARHVYERKGRYRLRVETVWEASFTMTGAGLTTPLPIDVEQATVGATREFPVVEYRSILVR